VSTTINAGRTVLAPEFHQYLIELADKILLRTETEISGEVALNGVMRDAIYEPYQRDCEIVPMNPIGHQMLLEKIQHGCFRFKHSAVMILELMNRKAQSHEVQGVVQQVGGGFPCVMERNWSVLGRERTNTLNGIPP
jgi:hypothetical protein